MIANLVITGVVIGLLVSIPVGPIGVLVIQRTVNKSHLSGFLSGMGAAMADLLFAVIACFSLSFVMEFVRMHQNALQWVGALIIIGLGVFILNKNPEKDLIKFQQRGNTLVRDWISTFLLTLTNPLTIFAFLAFFAGSGIVISSETPRQALAIVLGVFAGACLWWFTLTETVNIFRHKFNLRSIWWFNKIAGTAIIAFVVITLAVKFLIF